MKIIKWLATIGACITLLSIVYYSGIDTREVNVEVPKEMTDLVSEELSKREGLSYALTWYSNFPEKVRIFRDAATKARANHDMKEYVYYMHNMLLTYERASELEKIFEVELDEKGKESRAKVVAGILANIEIAVKIIELTEDPKNQLDQQHDL